jgi:4-hydroxy-2-oxoheptanedioate aldolase
MRTKVAIVLSTLAAATLVHTQAREHMNPVIDLLAANKAVFGMAPASNPRAPRGGGAADPSTPAPPAPPMKTPLELAKETLAYPLSDYIFNGSMEGGLDPRPNPNGNPAGPGAYATFAEFTNALHEAGALVNKRLPHPIFLKTPKFAPDPVKGADNISRQLDLGVSGIIMVGVESAAEVEKAIAAMRYPSKGGTRPDRVGSAAAYWGLSDAAYKEKADLWPLNPNGELMLWVIVESKEGLAHVREIAAVKGISAMFPGAGTLRGVFTTTDANGQRTVDQAGWENANQQVLAACKEFHVPCGYPASATDVETRLQQGFSVFVIQQWNDAGFKTVEIGRKAAGR